MKLHRHGFKAMGSPCALALYAPTRDCAEAWFDLCLEEIQRLEQKYTRYRDDSLTSVINRSAGDPAGIEVDDETASLLDYAATSYRESGGLFDITSGILRKAWDFKSGRLPAPEQLEALLEHVGWQRVRWERPRLVLPEVGMQLDFGGYVKEYAADRVAELCRLNGAGHGLVDLGGDIAIVGPHPDRRPWKVGVRDPRRPDHALATVDLWGGGIATSGDYERQMTVDGKRYGHILDPRTGWPVDGLVTVSVVASHCLIAGTASTIAMLRGRRAAPAWLDTLGLPNLRMDIDGAISGSLVAAPGRTIRARAAA